MPSNGDVKCHTQWRTISFWRLGSSHYLPDSTVQVIGKDSRSLKAESYTNWIAIALSSFHIRSGHIFGWFKYYIGSLNVTLVMAVQLWNWRNVNSKVFNIRLIRNRATSQVRTLHWAANSQKTLHISRRFTDQLCDCFSISLFHDERTNPNLWRPTLIISPRWVLQHEKQNDHLFSGSPSLLTPITFTRKDSLIPYRHVKVKIHLYLTRKQLL